VAGIFINKNAGDPPRTYDPDYNQQAWQTARQRTGIRLTGFLPHKVQGWWDEQVTCQRSSAAAWRARHR
jgi:hypothetical protein